MYKKVAKKTQMFQPTQQGNGQRFAALFGEDVRYVQDESRWCLWTGTHWALDKTGEIMRRAKTVARVIRHEVEFVSESGVNTWRAHARSSETKHGLDAMVALAASEKVQANDGSAFTITCSTDDFDRHKHLLNCPNGTIDLRTGELRPHRRGDLQRRITAVPYDAGARHPRWEWFLDEVTGGDDELKAYLQLLVGASLLGINLYDFVVVVFGPPGSGKSTFIQAILAALGSQYAGTASLDTFAERPASNGHSDDLASLEGIRFVASVEGEHTHTLAAALIKRISGGDAVTTRRVYRETRTWTPEMTVWLVTNELPRIHHDEAGLWRRVKAVPFENQVIRIDPTLRAELSDPETVGPAVLAWAVAGAVRLGRDGVIDDPAVVREATEEYRNQQTPASSVDAWLTACCASVDPSRTTPTSALLTSYQEWCTTNSISPDSPKRWGTLMGQRGYKDGRTAKGRFRRGVVLADEGEALSGNVCPPHAA